jgi:dihydrofolate synthase / folylpolyglutamate synthase
VFRTNKLAICGDENPPKNLVDYATTIGAHLALINRDFQISKTQTGSQYSAENTALRLPKIGLYGDFQLNNAACALSAVQALQQKLPVTNTSINAALRALTLTGRFQQIHKNPSIIVDVAHNPQAAQSLAHNLQASPCAGRTLAVFAMLADKDVEGVISAVAAEIDVWFVADIDNARGAKASELQAKLLKVTDAAAILIYTNVTLALQAAYKNAVKNDRIIVFGSFYTVADAVASEFNDLHQK